MSSRHVRRSLAALLLLTTLVGCGSSRQEVVSERALHDALRTAAGWMDDIDTACVLNAVDVQRSNAVADLLEHPAYARDADTAFALAVATANCAGPAQFTAQYHASLEVPAEWNECVRSAVDDTVAATILASNLLSDPTRASRSLDPLFACVVRTDPDVAVELGLPGLLAVSGMTALTPPDGPVCVQRALETSHTPDRIIALLLREAVTNAEVAALASALFDCADPTAAAALLSSTAGQELDVDCVSTSARSDALAVLTASLIGTPRPETALLALRTACTPSPDA